MSPAQEDKLQHQAEARIRETEEIVRRIDPGKLAGDRQETLSLVLSFLIRGKRALANREFERAFNLADKAFLLARELSASIH